MCDRTSVTPDFLWPEEKLALEYDSSEFHARKGAPQAVRDAARSNFLAIKGYRVLRVAAGNVSSLSGAALLARQIAFALGAPLREPTPLESQRRNKLYMELMPKAATGGCGRRATKRPASPKDAGLFCAVMNLAPDAGYFPYAMSWSMVTNL